MKMKTKVLFSLVALLLFFIAACQTAYKQETPKETASAQETVNAADSVSKDLNSTAADEQDLSSDGLNGIDSGLSDMQNI